jgi:hypothetical protein
MHSENAPNKKNSELTDNGRKVATNVKNSLVTVVEGVHLVASHHGARHRWRGIRFLLQGAADHGVLNKRLGAHNLLKEKRFLQDITATENQQVMKKGFP